MESVLLIGNGINNVHSNYEWTDLLKNLISYIQPKKEIKLNNKPFPLLYEEICLEAIRNKDLTEQELKNFIAKEVLLLEPNEIHKKILDLNIRNILTTNYDFTFEKLLINDVTRLNNAGRVKETTFNLFRQYSLDGYTFWHIHGDANSPQAITLGYEQYSGYLQHMRNYAVTGTGTSYKTRFDSILKQLKLGVKLNNDSWLNFFFTSNVYILGLTLDFIEIHLWWLLTFRQRTIIKSEYQLANNIFYFYPEDLHEKIVDKLELFKVVGVDPIPISNGNNAQDYYENVLSRISIGFNF